SKREDYHAMLFAHLSEAHGIDQTGYVSLIDYTLGGTPQTCDINRLAELARYAYAAAKQQSKTAADHLSRMVEEWRQASGADMTPDEVLFADNEAQHGGQEDFDF